MGSSGQGLCVIVHNSESRRRLHNADRNSRTRVVLGGELVRSTRAPSADDDTTTTLPSARPTSKQVRTNRIRFGQTACIRECFVCVALLPRDTNKAVYGVRAHPYLLLVFHTHTYTQTHVVTYKHIVYRTNEPRTSAIVCSLLPHCDCFVRPTAAELLAREVRGLVSQTTAGITRRHRTSLVVVAIVTVN